MTLAQLFTPDLLVQLFFIFHGRKKFQLKKLNSARFINFCITLFEQFSLDTGCLLIFDFDESTIFLPETRICPKY